MPDSDFIWRFTPSRTEPEILEAIFVQRESLLTDIVERVRESASSGNKHQVLLIGPRGIGKTHLIALLNHRITQEPAISDRVRIAWLLEDETITSFVQLLKRIYELLAENTRASSPKTGSKTSSITFRPRSSRPSKRS
jgi:predicted AAA+ superfamily ATPase